MTPSFPPGVMPLPAITDDSRPFWDACRRRMLVVQRCTDCGAFRHPPSPVCWQCRSFAHEWTPVAGHGTVFTHAVVHRAFLPGLEAAVPYVVVVVVLDDAQGVRLVSNLIDTDPAVVRVGLPVEVCFEDVSDEVTVPRFRVRGA
jgi:uncharacterized OB-fold protein